MGCGISTQPTNEVWTHREVWIHEHTEYHEHHEHHEHHESRLSTPSPPSTPMSSDQGEVEKNLEEVEPVPTPPPKPQPVPPKPVPVRKISRIFQCISPRAENILTAIKTLLIIIFYLTVYAAQVPTSAWDITVARRTSITPLPVATWQFDSTATTLSQALASASATRQ